MTAPHTPQVLEEREGFVAEAVIILSLCPSTWASGDVSHPVSGNTCRNVIFLVLGRSGVARRARPPGGPQEGAKWPSSDAGRESWMALETPIAEPIPYS